MKIPQNRIIILLLSAIFLGFNGKAQDKKLSLQEAKSLALEHNKKLQQAQKELEAANAGLAAAKAGGKPTLDASAMGIYLSGPLNTLLPELQASATLSVSQVIYAGGKIQTSKKLASSAFDLQVAQKALTEDEVLLQVETTYWNIVNLKEKNVLASKYLNLLTTLRTTLKNSFDAGLTYKNDLLKVEVKQNEAELNLTKVKDGLTMAKLSLAQLLYMQNDTFDVSENTIVKNVAALPAENSSTEVRPEIVMLGKAVEMQDLQTELLRGDQRPTLALGGYGVSAFGKHINFNNGNNTLPFFAGVVSLNIPILDWGKRRQKVKEQQLRTDAQKLELEETKELISLEVQNARFALSQSVKRISLSEKSVKQAEENLRLNQDRLIAGTVLGEDVLEAQVLWQQAYADLIDAKAEYKINEAKYKKAIGAY